MLNSVKKLDWSFTRKIKHFEIVGKKLVIVSTDFNKDNNRVTITTAWIDDYGKPNEFVDFQLPESISLHDSNKMFPIEKRLTSVNNLHMTTIKNSLGLFIKKNGFEGILVIKPEMPRLEMYPFLISPNSKIIHYRFMAHYFVSKNMNMSSFGYLVINTTILKQLNKYYLMIKILYD